MLYKRRVLRFMRLPLFKLFHILIVSIQLIMISPFVVSSGFASNEETPGITF